MASQLDKILSRAQRMDAKTGVPHQLSQLTFAAPGVGKTILTMEVAQEIRGDGKILYLDSKDGWVSLDSPKWKHLREDAIRIRVDDPRDLPPLADAIRRREKRLANVTVVVLDEFSSWVRIIAEQYVREKYGALDDTMMPEIQGSDWAPIGAAAVSILNTFLSVENVHVLIVSHSRQRGDEDSGDRKRWAPNFTPMLSTDILGLVHQSTFITQHLAGRGQFVRTIHTAPSASVVAKTRIDGMPPNPTREQFIQYTAEWVRGDRGSDNAVTAAEAINTLAATSLPEDVPQPEDEDDDQPVVVD